MAQLPTFALDARLLADTVRAGESDLSLLLWLDDSRYRWLVLVPKRPGLSEIYQLGLTDRAKLLDESCAVARTLSEMFSAFKINIGALGNIVRQLHVHHVARFENDPAWPGPVWGHSPRVSYAQDAISALTRGLSKSELSQHFSFGA